MCLIESADLNIIFIYDKDTGNFNPNLTHLKFKDTVYDNDKSCMWQFTITLVHAHMHIHTQD